jgi:2'-5' RNA ligase
MYFSTPIQIAASLCYNPIMDSYQQKQLKLITQIEERFKNGEAPSTIVEPVKDYKTDDRICLTGVVFIPDELEQRIIKDLVLPLQKADNQQYYYVPGSFHITIQNIRTINNPPLFSEKDIDIVKKVFQKVVPKHKAFSISIRRLFDLPTSLSIAAFSDEAFKNFVLELREELDREGVPDNKSYASAEVIFGNITIARYVQEPNNAFREKLAELKDAAIGELQVKNVSLITTNSVCIPNKTTIIGRYDLG